jgi:enamine deaminase RidA (YjgF/YER057c/UK114 family)
MYPFHPAIPETSSIEARLQELGIELPDVNPPGGNYVPYRITGNLVFIAGQTCKWNNQLQYTGKVGKDYTLQEGQDAARICGLNILMHLKTACEGNLEQVRACIRIGVFINSTDDFIGHAQVANGVSDLMVAVFGDKGKHSRTSVSANSLPSHSAVEVEALFEVAS